MKTKKVKKRAEMTSKEIVGLIIVIFCFLVVLVFIGIMQWRASANQDACHESVVLRSSFNFGAFELGKNIPLKCKTENICLSMSGDDCVQAYGKNTKDNPVTTTKINLNKDPNAAREQIKSAIADSMYDCNSILGEGKLDFMPHKFYKEDYCMLCSRVALDKTAMNSIAPIAYWELYDLLSKKQTLGGKSYLESIYPGWKNPRDSEKLFAAMQADSSASPELKSLQYINWNMNMNLSQGYTIAAKMSPAATWQKYAKMTGVAVGAVVAVASLAYVLPASAVGVIILGVSSKAIGAGAVAYAGYIFVYDHPNDQYQWTPPTIYPYDSDTLNSLKCTSFEMTP